jgi:hypothetical protein
VRRNITDISRLDWLIDSRVIKMNVVAYRLLPTFKNHFSVRFLRLLLLALLRVILLKA